MIVKLCNTDLLKLVNGEAIAVQAVIVQTTDDEHSSVTGMVENQRTTSAALTGRGNARSSKPRRSGVHQITARFANKCYSPGCPERWEKGDQIVYDYDHQRAYCLGHGQSFLKKAEEANAR